MAIHAELAPYDAFGGAAYGKKEMPFAITAGIAAGSALAAGAVVGTAATAAAIGAVVAGTAVAAGLTMTIVGMATGDKELMKIGGYVGLAGGIAGAGLNMAGFGAEAFSAMESAASAANAANAIPAAATNAAAGGISSGAALESAVTPAFQSMANPVAQTGATMGQIGSGSLQATASQALTPAFEAAKTGAMTAGQVAPNVLANAPQAITPALSELGATAIKAAPTAAQAIGGTTAAGAQGAGTLFDGLIDFVKTPTGVATLGTLASSYATRQTQGATNDIYKNKIAFDQQQEAYKMANANAIAPYNMTTTQLTDAQRQQANIDKYNQARKAAGILTNTQQATA